MLDWLNNAVLSLADPLLNWLLRLPTDLTLVIVAAGTGAIITLARLLCTNQDLLRRCDQDKKRLKKLTGEAKRAGGKGDRSNLCEAPGGRAPAEGGSRQIGPVPFSPKEAVKRYRTTRAMIGMMTMKQEGWPLLAAIVPIAVLATWCFQRLAFVPPRAGAAVPLVAYFPVSAVGQLAHLVPQEGVHEVSRADSDGRERWIQEIVEDPDPKPGARAGAVAIWKLQADAGAEPYRLEIRYKNCTVRKELLVGQPVYSPDVEFYGDDRPVQSAQIGMEPVKFLGVVPGIAWLLLPPWLVAYFLIAIPSVGLIKRVTGIY